MKWIYILFVLVYGLYFYVAMRSSWSVDYEAHEYYEEMRYNCNLPLPEEAYEEQVSEVFLRRLGER